jgi:glutamine synthetase
VCCKLSCQVCCKALSCVLQKLLCQVCCKPLVSGVLQTSCVRYVANLLCQVCCKAPLSDVLQSFFVRYVARRQLERLASLGYSLLSGVELEFTLLNEETRAPIFTGKDFFSNLCMTQHSDFLCGLDKVLQEARISLNDLHVEPAQGQFEVNYEPVWGLQGGDWPFFVREAIKEMAIRY